jgi:hypothetical protein
LDEIDRRERLGRVVVVGRREVDPDRTFVWVAERVALQSLADDRFFIEPPTQLDRPGTNRNPPLRADLGRRTLITMAS